MNASYLYAQAMRGFKQRVGLSLLVIATLSIGLGLLMTVRTLGYKNRREPIANKSHLLHSVQFDGRPTTAPDIDSPLRLDDMPYLDAHNLTTADTPAHAQTMLWSIRGIMGDTQQELEPMATFGVAASANFFSMFDARFEYGGAWEPEAAASGTPVAVISQRANAYLFGGGNNVGQQFRLEGQVLTVVGILEEWPIIRRFYDRSYRNEFRSDVFVPHAYAQQANLRRWGRADCDDELNKVTMDQLARTECPFVVVWAWLDDADQARAYREFVDGYVSEQKRLGRLPREQVAYVTSIETQARLYAARAGDSILFDAIASLFFAVCLVNAIGILLAKFLARSKEVSLRRALGASRRVIMLEHLLEVLAFGIASGSVGLGLSHLGLRGMLKIRVYASDYTIDPSAIDSFYTLDSKMMCVAVGIALISGVAIGLYPIYRVCRIAPGSQLRSQ